MGKCEEVQAQYGNPTAGFIIWTTLDETQLIGLFPVCVSAVSF